MPFKSSWTLTVRCNSKHQAEEVFNSLFKSLPLPPPAASYHSSSSILPPRSWHQKGFEVCFALIHNVAQADAALSLLLNLSRKLSGGLQLYFRNDGEFEAQAGVRDVGRPASIHWHLKPMPDTACGSVRTVGPKPRVRAGPCKSFWKLTLRCKSRHKAEEIVNSLFQTLGLPKVEATYTSPSSIYPPSIYGRGLSKNTDFEVRFELDHAVMQTDAESFLFKLSQKLAETWTVFFELNGDVQARSVWLGWE